MLYAYIGNVTTVDDEYVIVYRDDAKVVNLGTDDAREAQERAEDLIYRSDKGYVIPDLYKSTIIYR
jgi:hypothetical protein